ncbi:MAG: SDR family oxidoreductase [Anaerolineae bacterium]|jgi:dihydroflavonol-4-reductase|nr:SDR family oxidoreductase [Anaerolineae bacterium]
MILVTGAAGHLGNVLVRELLDRGEKVRALVLPGEDTTAIDGLAIERVDGNVLDLESLRRAMDGVDLVYHMAAIVAITPGQEARLWQVNVDGTRNVIQACLEKGVRRLVYTSSIHALARPPEGVTIDESLPFDTNNPAGDYDRSKAAASLEVLAAIRKGLDAVIVCPTGVVGPHDYRWSEMGHMVLDWMSHRLHVMIDGAFDFVDVRDVAWGHVLAAQHGRTGEVYILSGERITILKIKELVQELVGIHSPSLQLPYTLARFFTNFTPLWYRLTRTRPRFTSYALETIISNSVISYDKAGRELGYRARSLRDSLSDTIRWWREIGLRVNKKPTASR